MRRGRSRSISTIALARQASEERRLSLLVTATTTSASLTPSTTRTVSHPSTTPLVSIIDLTTSNDHEEQDCIYPASPTDSSSSSEFMASGMPTNLSCSGSSSLPPPLTLQDQVHVAYASDNIHLAKILLLKLKGIEVTSDSDPRIAAVQPEDFDECFIPAGGFMSQEDEEVIKEMQRVERERLRVEQESRQRREHEEAERRRRREWELHCEKIWEGEKRRMREEKKFLERKREEERRRWEDAERKRKEAAERRVTAASRYSSRSSLAITKTKARLSYAGLTTERVMPSSLMSSTEDDKYLYSFLPVKPPSPPSRRRQRGPSPPSSSPSSSCISAPHGSTSSTFSHAIHNATLGNECASEVESLVTINTPAARLTVAEKDSPPLDSDSSTSRGHLSPSFTSDPMHLTVCFRDVLASMRGPLFPIETEADSRPRHPRAESTEGSQSQSPNSCRSQSKGRLQDPSLQYNPKSTVRRRRRNEELLSVLLAEVKWTEGERLARGKVLGWSGKGQSVEKGKERTLTPLHPTRQNSSSSIRSSSSTSSCAACSAASGSSNTPTSPTSPTSSAVSRTGSWLSSFSSSSSTSTDITTPSTSLSSSPLKTSLSHVQRRVAASAPTSSVKSTVAGWLRKSAIAASTQQNQVKESQRRQESHLIHSCHRPPFSRLTQIMAFDGPLPLEDADESKSILSVQGGVEGGDEVGSRVDTKSNCSVTCANDGIGIDGAAGIARQMTRLVELAKGFQTAYINMTVFGTVPTVSYGESAWSAAYDELHHKARRERVWSSSSQAAVKLQLHPVGYRASKADIDAFLIRRNVGGVRKEREGIPRGQLNDEVTANHTSLGSVALSEARADEDTTIDDRGRSAGRRSNGFEEEGVEYIPLLPPRSSVYPAKTVLPNPLPYNLVFKPPLPLVPSPHRRVTLQQVQRVEDGMEFGSLSPSPSYPYPSLTRGTGRFSSRMSSSPPPRSPARSRGASRSNSLSPTRRSSLSRLQNSQQQLTPIARPRVVANPVYLRLKAVRNVGLELGKNWELGQGKNCGPLSGGKEKVLALTWDEVGRSVLGHERDGTLGRRASLVKGALVIPSRGGGGGIDADRANGDQRRGRHGKDEFHGVRRGRCVVRG
ncbi:hypothetical protein L218DRAFT_1072185 [Marasmius fiardii PR-910]|nr:hypothetical protein L218DRAFT_1072185 [Marasmius fiardii PR-910]